MTDEKKATCQQCGYEWSPNVDHPKQCPRCKRYDWDEESKKAAQ